MSALGNANSDSLCARTPQVEAALAQPRRLDRVCRMSDHAGLTWSTTWGEVGYDTVGPGRAQLVGRCDPADQRPERPGPTSGDLARLIA